MLFYPLATKQYTVLFLPNSHVNLEPRVSCALHNSPPRAKDGKRQKGQGLDVLDPFPIPLSATSCTHLPLQGRQKCLFNSGSPKSVSFLGRGERNGVFIMNFAKIHSNTEFLSTYRRGELVVANCVLLKITFVCYFGKSYLSFTSLLLLSKSAVRWCVRFCRRGEHCSPIYSQPIAYFQVKYLRPQSCLLASKAMG